MIKRYGRTAAGFLILAAAAALLLSLNLSAGSTRLTGSELFGALTGASDGPAVVILWEIRIPRLLAAALLGGALAVSGFLLQSFFHNPIAGPYVLGISSGAKLCVALAMVLALSRGTALTSVTMVAAASFGAFLSTAFVLAVAGKIRNMSLLVVCGVMVSYLCSAATDFLVTFADDSNIVNLHSWSLGSFSGISMENIRFLFPWILAGLLFSVYLTKPMEACRLGDSAAAGLGVNLKVYRTELIVLSSLLSALVTAFAGPVSFVGIAVPHLMRQLFRSGKPRILVPACFLGGAVFCLASDLIARTLFSPAELSISSVTSVLGAPIVIRLMLKRNERRQG